MTAEAALQALDRIGADEHNAYITRFDEPVVTAEEGPLADLSLAVKDNLALARHPLTCASDALRPYTAPYTATAVERALCAGASVVGKTNLDEFGAGSRGRRSAFGPTGNPAAPGRVPGGSSSGSAATLAAGHVDLALGTDTGGSARAPAAYCGLVALKPTYGRISRWGLVDLGMSLDTVGPMARTVGAAARFYDAIAGPDPRDPTSLGQAPEPAMPRVGAPDLEGVRLGVPEELPQACAPEVRQAFEGAVEAFEAEGATIEPVTLPDPEQALCVYYVTNYAEFASAMHKFDGTVFGDPDSRRLLGTEVKRRVLLGTFITARGQYAAWYGRARAARAHIRARWRGLFEKVDLVLTPTMPTPPPSLEEHPSPLEEYAADVLTVQPNLAGLPAGSVPMGATDEGPMGLQVVGPHGADAAVLEAMALYEEVRR